MSNMAFISPASNQNGLAFTHFRHGLHPSRKRRGMQERGLGNISMQSFHELL